MRALLDETSSGQAVVRVIRLGYDGLRLSRLRAGRFRVIGSDNNTHLVHNLVHGLSAEDNISPSTLASRLRTVFAPASQGSESRRNLATMLSKGMGKGAKVGNTRKLVEDKLDSKAMVTRVEGCSRDCVALSDDARRQRLGLLAFPMGEAGLVPLNNLVAILSAISSHLCVITGGTAIALPRPENNMTLTWIASKAHANGLGRVLSYAGLQVRMAYELASATRKVDTWILFIGGDTLLLPLLTAKLFRKKVVLIRAGSSVETLEAAQDKMAGILGILSGWGQRLSDRIVVYSPASAQSMTGHDLSDRILVARHHYVDPTLFRSVLPAGSRTLTVGYLGRLEPEKGIREFVQAIPIVARARPDVRFLIAGDGALRRELEEYLRREHLETVVVLRGWVPHDEVPLALNSMRIVVLPSYTEGLPNILVESMACGTAVVATPVGGIPDFVKDGITGFLVEGNDPGELARGILRALSHPNLENIIANASALAASEFSYAKAVEGFAKATHFE